MGSLFAEQSAGNQATVAPEDMVLSAAATGVAKASVGVATGHAWREGFQLVSWP